MFSGKTVFYTFLIVWHIALVFSIPYDRQCHILYEHDATNVGQVISPFYDEGAYPDGLWCEYRIRAPEGYRIKISFKDLDIDPTGSCADRLVVYGKDKETVLGEFCGYELPKPILSNPGENEIRLLFYTDFMVSGRGFILQYESAPSMELCNKDEGLCRNRNCYRKEKKCDGVDDCGDGTDEEKCGKTVAQPSTECGETPISPHTIYNSEDRQVGGTAAVPNSWPWQVSLQHTLKEPNSHFCGGSLISPQWVVTAGHCVAGTTGDPHDMKIVLGSHNKYNKTKYEVVRVAEKIITYPDLEGEKLRQMTFTHDIALVKLNAPVTYSDGIQPVCLPSLGWEPQPGWSCYSTGWGETRGSGFADVLKQTEQIVQSKDDCSYDHKTQVCVAKTYNSPCHGDSGGPLVCKLGNKWWLFGATSFGSDSNFISGLCGVPGAKVVFASVADKADWIQQLINKYN